MNTTYILKIKEFPNVYIGSTSNFSKRLTRHKYDLKRNKHHSVLLQTAWNISSSKELNYELFIFDNRDHAYELEQFLIDEMRLTGFIYNIGNSVVGGDNITYNPNRELIIKNIGKGLLKKYSEMTDQERKIKCGRPGSQNGMYGKTHTSEIRALLSAHGRSSGKKNLGIVRSQETRDKMSSSAKKRKGQLNSFYNKSHSEETKRQLSKQMLGKKPPNEISIIVDGVKYRSITEAGRMLNIPTVTVLHRLKSKNVKFSNYKYVT